MERKKSKEETREKDIETHIKREKIRRWWWWESGKNREMKKQRQESRAARRGAWC